MYYDQQNYWYIKLPRSMNTLLITGICPLPCLQVTQWSCFCARMHTRQHVPCWQVRAALTLGGITSQEAHATVVTCQAHCLNTLVAEHRCSYATIRMENTDTVVCATSATMHEPSMPCSIGGIVCLPARSRASGLNLQHT